MKKLLLGAAAILAGLSAGANAGVSVSEIKHLEFENRGAIVGRSEETGYIIRQLGESGHSPGFEVIDANATFTQAEVIQEIINLGLTTLDFFDNYPRLPSNPDQFSSIGLSAATTEIEYLDIANSLLENAEAKLRGASIILASGPGYIVKGVAGDYFVLAKGEVASRTVYRCKLSEISNDIDSYLNTCDGVLLNHSDQGVALEFGFIRFVNNSGYIVYSPSYGTQHYTLIYPDGTKYTIPTESALGHVYISDEEEPSLHYGGQVFDLTSTGPVLNESESLINNEAVLISKNNNYNYYVTPYDAGLGVPIFKHTVCKKSDGASSVQGEDVKVTRFSIEDAKQYIIETNSSISSVELEIINSYPNLPADEILEQAGSPFSAGMTQTEFDNILSPMFESVMAEANQVDDIEEGFFSEDLNLFCEDDVKTGHYPIITINNPYSLLSETGVYVSPVGTAIQKGFFLKSVDDGSGIGIYSEVANYMLERLSVNSRTTLLNSLIESNKLLATYPDYTAEELLTSRTNFLSDNSASGFDVTLEEAIDQKRAETILEALGNDIGLSAPLLGKDGVFAFDFGVKSTHGWVLSTSVSTSNSAGLEVIVSPQNETIDPYNNPFSQFTIDVSGSEVYGLDVSCNLSSTALSVTQANYDGLFGSQNSITLPLIYDASSVTGTETLVAPELPFTGAGSFVLADVLAEFTTENVEITCAAEVSDEHGQLMQVALTPATIRIDDGVHGGTGSVSGVIEIPGVTDLSSVEVVLTIDGRQVTVITDETGRFEFDGLRDGEFTISLASDNYVQSCQAANVADGGAVDLGSIELLAGDINADGNIDIADFTFMAARYRSNQGDADYDAKADLNKDGTINIQDLAILGSHFGSTQCNL